LVPKVIGRYAVFDEVAAGGMATVHLGRLLAGEGFSRTVAVKRLHPQFARDPDFVTMFLDEARLASRIRHPNVVSTLDIEAAGDDVLLVMEYVAGESLSRLMKAGRPDGAPVPIAVAVMTSVLHGLHAAHEATTEQGIPLDLVHRDVSPQNILVGVDGVARVLDFGVAKASHRAQTTKEGQLKGKLSYMAPEQLRRDAVDRRTDVYSAAVVLWECIAGEKLFDGESEARVVMKLLSDVVPPPSRRRPGVPPDLDAVVLRGLAREPTERFASAREMAIALERCAVTAAAASSVGGWVEALAATSLAARATRVAEIERMSDQGIPPAAASSSRRVALLAPAAAGARSSFESMETLPHRVDPETVPSSVRYNTSATLPGYEGARPRRRIAAIAVGIVALLAFAIVTFVIVSRNDGSPRAAASVTAQVAATPPPPLAEAAVPDAPAVAPAQDRAPPPPPPPVTAPEARRPSAVAAPRTAASFARPDHCKPPYTVDGAGIRHIKAECM
jgi:serine/threonine-protein kinase